MARPTPTDADLERAIVSVPGVAEAHVARVEATGRSRLRIRLANDEDAEAVSWAIAATLRERFGISLDPDQIRPRPEISAEVHDAATETADAEVHDAATETADAEVHDGATETADAEVHDEPTSGGPGTSGPEPASDPGGAPDDDPDDGDEAPDVSGGDTTVTEMADRDPSDGVQVRGDRILLSDAARELLEEAVAEAQGMNVEAPATITSVPSVTTPRDDAVRARIRHLDTRVDVSDVEVTATLAFGGREVTGSARSVATAQGILRAVAESTLHALSELTGDRLVAGIDQVAASVAGDPPMATVVVSVLTDRGDETLLGSSLVRKDPERAVMRATLDAVNRRVEPWLEIELAG